MHRVATERLRGVVIKLLQFGDKAIRQFLRRASQTGGDIWHGPSAMRPDKTNIREARDRSRAQQTENCTRRVENKLHTSTLPVAEICVRVTGRTERVAEDNRLAAV